MKESIETYKAQIEQLNKTVAMQEKRVNNGAEAKAEENTKTEATAVSLLSVVAKTEVELAQYNSSPILKITVKDIFTVPKVIIMLVSSS